MKDKDTERSELANVEIQEGIEKHIEYLKTCEKGFGFSIYQKLRKWLEELLDKRQRLIKCEEALRKIVKNCPICFEDEDGHCNICIAKEALKENEK